MSKPISMKCSKRHTFADVHVKKKDILVKKGQSVLITQANLMFPSISLLLSLVISYFTSKWCQKGNLNGSLYINIVYVLPRKDNVYIDFVFAQVNLCVIYCLFLFLDTETSHFVYMSGVRRRVSRVSCARGRVNPFKKVESWSSWFKSEIFIEPRFWFLILKLFLKFSNELQRLCKQLFWSLRFRNELLRLY